MHAQTHFFSNVCNLWKMGMGTSCPGNQDYTVEREKRTDSSFSFFPLGPDLTLDHDAKTKIATQSNQRQHTAIVSRSRTAILSEQRWRSGYARLTQPHINDSPYNTLLRSTLLAIYQSLAYSPRPPRSTSSDRTAHRGHSSVVWRVLVWGLASQTRRVRLSRHFGTNREIP